jgi:DNA polymerase
MIYHIDFETRSEADLKEVGLHNYARDPSTEPWCMSYAAGDDEPSMWVLGERFPLDLRMHVDAGGEVWAHNVPFELEIWNEICHRRYGWPELKPEQAWCTMAQCYAMGLPGALEDAGMALGLRVLKDTEGRALMLRMARPRKRNPTIWWDEPEKLARLYEYCKQDVRVEREIHKRVMPLSAFERRVWLADYAINKRGVKVDRETAQAAIKMAEALKAKYDREMEVATGGAATSCSALIPIKKWLADNGCPQAADGMAKQDLIDLLADDTIPEPAKRVLSLRQEAGKASAAKFNKMIDQAGADGRLHFLYQFHGAASGRWAGRSVQPHNLVRDMPKPHVVEEVFRLVREEKYELIDMLYGSPLSMITRSIRSIFIPDTGKIVVGGDWSNVEGRGQAWFAGEWWKVKAFLEADAKTGPGLYELAYSRMFNIPVAEIIAKGKKANERQIGKVAELAFGYQGGVGSFHIMGKNYNVKVSDADADKFKEAWRDAHPRIAGKRDEYGVRRGGMWQRLQNAAISAVASPGLTTLVERGDINGPSVKFKMVGSFLWMLLPSGRAICFPYPKLLEGSYGPMLTFMAVPDPNKPEKVIYDPANGPRWARVGTYGGAIFNRVIQGMCRDFLAELIVDLHDQGASIIIHTHDDCNIEVDRAKAGAARDAMERMMCTPPGWAKGFPLYAGCDIMERYGAVDE